MTALPGTPKKELTLLDTTCLIVGIIVGVGIFQVPPLVAASAGSAVAMLAVWAAGGLLSLCGGLVYAELATAWPREGGDYVYLSRAYGRWAGFLFGWIQLVIVRPGDIAATALAFATYACAIYDPLGGSQGSAGTLVYAGVAVAALTVLNVAGVRLGKWAQNVLTIVKALGLVAIVGAALLAALLAPPAAARPQEAAGGPPLALAFILVLFTFGGWNEMAYVAAEVKDSRRNIVRAMALGILAVAGLYLLVNAAYLLALGYAGVASSKAVAADAVSGLLAGVGVLAVSALVCTSALGSVNGLIFTGARISYALGAEHRGFGPLGRWQPRTGTPAAALLVQGAIAIALVVALKTFFNTVVYTAATVYAFYLATSIAVIVLRFREPQTERPYRVLGYPVTPLVFAGVCAFLIYSAVKYLIYIAEWNEQVVAVISFGLLALGVPVYLLTRRGNRPPA
ncbi:MAG: amino acid permease [Planctomycetes bacterium]|nr:amino acid permease [Planctomycetota bacterium]